MFFQQGCPQGQPADWSLTCWAFLRASLAWGRKTTHHSPQPSRPAPAEGRAELVKITAQRASPAKRLRETPSQSTCLPTDTAPEDDAHSAPRAGARKHRETH